MVARNKQRKKRSSSLTVQQWCVIFSLVVALVAWLSNSNNSRPPTHQDVMRVWSNAVGGKVTIKESPLGGVGLFATTNIAKGDVILQVPPKYKITSKGIDTPELRSIVKKALSDFNNDESPTSEQMMVVIAALLELQKGEKSFFYPYLQTLPQNVSQTAFYWSAEERTCVVPRPIGGPEKLQATMRNFRLAFQAITTDSSYHHHHHRHLSSLDLPTTKQAAEWLYLMIKTRGFFTGDAAAGAGGLIPILDHANHDPTLSVPPFVSNNTHYMVATHDIPAGTEIFNTYRELSPVESAEIYGFVDDDAAFVEAPSLTRDMMIHAARTDRMMHDEGFASMCTKTGLKFFGNVTHGRVEARFKQHLRQTTFFYPFRPTQLAYQCTRVLLQSENAQDLAAYFVDRLEKDAIQYETMARASHCQNNEGNYPLIRQSNAVTAQLLRAAMEEARRVLQGDIEEYPGVPYP